MMNKRILLLAATTMLLFACKNSPNEPEPEPTPEPEPMTQEQAMETYFTQPVAFHGAFIETGNALRQVVSTPASAPARVADEPSYPHVGWTPQDGTWPIDVTVDYGTKGVIASDGLEHKGKLALHATARFEEEGSVITPSFTDFYVYGNVLTAKQVIKNLGKNKDGDLVFDVTVDEGALGTQRELIYSEHTQRALISGLNADGTLNADVKTHTYAVTGWMQTDSKIDTIPGCKVTLSEEAPMTIAVGDLYPVKGKVHIDLDKELTYQMPPMTINYKSADLEFTGKNDKNQYGAITTVPYNMGPVTQTAKFSFLLDANGIVPNSLTPILEQ